MCDCYSAKCQEKGCDSVLPVHITNFCTLRDNVQVFCGKHIPKDKRVSVWRVTQSEGGFRKGNRISIHIIDFRKVRHQANYLYSVKTAVTPNMACYEFLEVRNG